MARISCPDCQLVSINGVVCHERGCPNSKSRYDRDTETWIKQRTCFHCGFEVDANDPCCDAPVEDCMDDEDADDAEDGTLSTGLRASL